MQDALFWRLNCNFWSKSIKKMFLVVNFFLFLVIKTQYPDWIHIVFQPKMLETLVFITKKSEINLFLKFRSVSHDALYKVQNTREPAVHTFSWGTSLELLNKWSPIDFFGPKRHSLRSLPFPSPKNSQFSVPTPFQRPSKWICPHQNHYTPLYITIRYINSYKVPLDPGVEFKSQMSGSTLNTCEHVPDP